MSQTFPRAARLLKATEFQRVFADPRRISNRRFVVLARRNGLPQARLGLAIAKKAARRAVDRNRIKRLIRESFRRWATQFRGLDVVVMTKPGTAACPNSELREALQALWQELAAVDSRGRVSR